MWKQIKGYEGYYEVSDDGRVRSMDRYVYNTRGRDAGSYRYLRGADMKLTESDKGYLLVNLRKDGKARLTSVHILVANAFLSNPNDLPVVNHLDGNKHNNSVSNLEWASYATNNAHAVHTCLRRPRGNTVVQFTVDGRYVATYHSATEASRLTGFSRGGISHCINGKAEQSFGYIWRKQSESATTIPFGSTPEDELPAEAQRPHSCGRYSLCRQ